MKRKVFALVVATAALLVALLVAELVVRVAFPQKLSVNVTQWDADVGFVNSPGAEGYGERIDYRMHVTINSKGLRDREFSYAKPPNTIRIGAFGDSFTFGEGVQNDETFAKRLEEILRPYAKRAGLAADVEVLNFGIGKTGTSHQLAWYRKEGHNYGLDVVVLAMYAGNDIEDNWTGVYAWHGSELVHNATSYSSVRRIQSVVIRIPAYRWLAQHSHLVNLVRVGATLYDDRRRRQKATRANTADVATAEDLTERKYALTRKLVDVFRHEVEGDGAHFLLVTVPQYEEQRLANYSAPGLAPPFVPLLDRLLSELAYEQVDVLDAVFAFENTPQRMSYYLPHDRHFSAAGHVAFAQLLARHLEPRLGTLRGVPPASKENGDGVH